MGVLGKFNDDLPDHCVLVVSFEADIHCSRSHSVCIHTKNERESSVTLCECVSTPTQSSELD